MAILLSVHNLSKSFAHRPLFESIQFGIESGDRVGLIGPNGAGKTTLLNILASRVEPDGGTISMQRGLRVGYAEQAPQISGELSVEEAVGECLSDPNDWQETQRASEIISRLSLEPKSKIKNLSGGWLRRLSLARELTRAPDLLLLDEPTNHLDIESILWLEQYLAKARFATLTITHDRLFLQRIANRIFELDRRNPGGLLAVSGSYVEYLEKKESLMAAQENQERKMRNTLRRETEWLRRGAQARQTKQRSRIERAEELRESVDEVAERNQKSVINVDFSESENKPKRLIEIANVSKSFDGVAVVPNISLLVTPKSRVALMGPNGCGKTTFLKLLMKSEAPDTGSIFHSEHLQIAYFDQNRGALDPEITLMKTVCPVGEFVEWRGGRIQVRAYLAKFLFHSHQMEMPIGKLSGGEQSRILLARLMLRPSNVLILDEPTNDLDLETLNVLQEILQEYSGAIILVSHDRYFVGQIANQLLAFGFDSQGNKTIDSLASMEQWAAWHDQQRQMLEVKENQVPVEEIPKAKSKGRSKGEQKNLDRIVNEIEKLEETIEQLNQKSYEPEIATDSQKLIEINSEIKELQDRLNSLYLQWEELS